MPAAPAVGAKPHVAMHWFRKGLRLHDNPALRSALKTSNPKKVYPVYVLDGDCFQVRQCNALRANFLVQCLADLDRSLRAAGSRLYVVRGDPVDALPLLWDKWNVSRMTFEADQSTEPYAEKRDRMVLAAAKKAGVSVDVFSQEMLFDCERYEALAGGACNLPETYSSFEKLFGRLGKVPKPVPVVTAADFPITSIDADGGGGEDEHAGEMLPPKKATDLPWPRMPRDEVSPVWAAADCVALTPAAEGGESAARARLARATRDASWVAGYDKPKTSPATMSPTTTVLSPYMSIGCLSPREVWHAIDNAVEGAKKAGVKLVTSPPVSLHGQVMWREFNTLMGRKANDNMPGSWGRMEDNILCRNIPWERNCEVIEAWKLGRTGYPWIDACMAQLRQEGWIHHLSRHAVACFLTRGDLWQHWEEGAKHFEEHLLDADYSLNNFNWLWLSCSGFFYQYFRCYSPVSFQKKNDPEGLYIRKYIPALERMPAKYIYEPWLAPKSVQQMAGCVIGSDYPEPIVDHQVMSKLNMGKMAEAYKAYQGNNKRVSASQPGKGKKTKRK